MAAANLNNQENSHQKEHFHVKEEENSNQDVVTITSDGACLFRSISYLIFGTEAMFLDVRQAIVLHIIKNWKYFSPMIYESQGHRCKSIAEYFAEMSKPFTQGGVPEIQAAVEVYNVVFEVYSGGELYFRIGQEGRPVVTLRYSDPLENNAYIINNQVLPLQTISMENLSQGNNVIFNGVNYNITLNQDMTSNLNQKIPIANPTWATQTGHGLEAHNHQGISTSNKYSIIQEKPKKRYTPTTRVLRKRFRQRLHAREKLLAYESSLQREQEILRLRCQKEMEQNCDYYGPSAVNIKQEVEDITIDTIEIEEPNLIQIKQEPEFVYSDVD